MDNTINQDTGKLVREQVTSAVHNIVTAVEPQINDFATRAAEQAMDRGRDFAKSTYRQVQMHPMYLIGFAAILLIGASILIGFQNRTQVSTY